MPGMEEMLVEAGADAQAEAAAVAVAVATTVAVVPVRLVEGTAVPAAAAAGGSGRTWWCVWEWRATDEEDGGSWRSRGAGPCSM